MTEKNERILVESTKYYILAAKEEGIGVEYLPVKDLEELIEEARLYGYSEAHGLVVETTIKTINTPIINNNIAE